MVSNDESSSTTVSSSPASRFNSETSLARNDSGHGLLEQSLSLLGSVLSSLGTSLKRKVNYSGLPESKSAKRLPQKRAQQLLGKNGKEKKTRENNSSSCIKILGFFKYYQVYKYETGNFFDKIHVYLIKMVIHSIFKVMAIASHTFFPSLWQFVHASPEKLFVF